MAEAPGVDAFRDNDRFLRRIPDRHHVKRNGLIHWRVFKDNDERLSFTFQNGELGTEPGLDAYQYYCGNQYFGGNLPGICWLSYHGLTAIKPPLVPLRDPDPDDPVYGHLHCSTPRPQDKPHMELLQKVVNDGEHGGLYRHWAAKPTSLE